MFEKRKQALAESARPHLEPGESAQAVFIGQTFVSPLVYFLIGPIVFMFVAKQRVAIATERNVYVLSIHFLKGKEVREVVAKYPLVSARVEAGRASLQIGDSERLWAFLFGFRDIEAFVASVDRARAALPEATTAT